MRRLIFWFFLVMGLAGNPASAASYPDRFVWIFGWNLARDSDVAEVSRVLETGAKHGITGAVVPKDLTIVVWGGPPREQSLRFFSEQGFRTLIACYYDADNLDRVKDWLQLAQQTPNVRGFMYTPWQKKFALLPEFSDLLKSTYPRARRLIMEETIFCCASGGRFPDGFGELWPVRQWR